MNTAEREEDEPPAPILVVGGQQSPPLTVSIELNGVPVTMEVDTGATVSLMSEQKQQQLCAAGEGSSVTCLRYLQFHK